MAKKRMFSSAIVTSDAFLDLPPTAQNLYWHLCVRADDEGFLNDVRAIARTVQATPSDIDALVNARFLLAFGEGVYCIKHWCMHNRLTAGRFAPTQYTDERKSLTLKENGAYTERGNMRQTCVKHASSMSETCRKHVGSMSEACLEENRIEENRIEENRIDYISSDTSSIISTLSSSYTGADTNDADRDSVPQSSENPSVKNPQSASSEDVSEMRKPSRADVEAYIVSHDYKVDADAFCDKYDALSWTLRGEPIQDWRAVVRAWHANAGRKKKTGYAEHEYTDDDFKKLEIAKKNKMFEGRKKDV